MSRRSKRVKENGGVPQKNTVPEKNNQPPLKENAHEKIKNPIKRSLIKIEKPSSLQKQNRPPNKKNPRRRNRCVGGGFFAPPAKPPKTLTADLFVNYQSLAPQGN